MSSWGRLLQTTGILMLSASGRRVADDPHSRVHQGVMYHCSAISTNLANDANLDMMITTPADDAIHMIVEAAAGGLSELRVYEGTVATGGTPEEVMNLKRTSTREWSGVMVSGPTVSDVGTLLSAQVMPGGVKNQAIGSSSAFTLEWICKVSTAYLIRLTNRSGGALRASIGCNHYSAAVISDT